MEGLLLHKELIAMLFRALLLVVTLGFSWTVCAEPETPEDYVKIFQSTNLPDQEKAAQSLEWAGISSPRLYDLVEAKALEYLPRATDRTNVNYVAHLTNALAYSGNEKYRPTIEKIIQDAPHKRLKKYATQALGQLSLYSQLNPLIAPKPWPEYTHPSLEQRLVNMLNSGNDELVRMAAKRIHFTNNYQPELLALLSAGIQQRYQQPMGGLALDTTAWMCRALAGSRDEQYKALIEQVAKGAKEKKLAKYAKKYLSYFGQ